MRLATVLLTFPAIDDSKLTDVKKDMKYIDKVGEITVKVYRGGETESISGISGRNTKLGRRASSVHEKALKGQAKSHSTS